MKSVYYKIDLNTQNRIKISNPYLHLTFFNDTDEDVIVQNDIQSDIAFIPAHSSLTLFDVFPKGTDTVLNFVFNAKPFGYIHIINFGGKH